MTDAPPFTLHLGDCLDVLRALPDNSIDAVVTDPPYGLGKEPDALAMLRDWIETGLNPEPPDDPVPSADKDNEPDDLFGWGKVEVTK